MNEDKLWSVLEEKLNVSRYRPQHGAVLDVSAERLVDPNALAEVLAIYYPLIGGVDQEAGEVYMARWMINPMMAAIYSLALHESIPDLSLSNLTAYISKDQVVWQLKQQSLLEPGGDVNRLEWSKEMLSALISNTVRPLFEAIAVAGTARLSLLWSQLPTYLIYSCEQLMACASDEDERNRLAAMYTVMHELPPSTFGRSSNPLAVTFQYTESLTDPCATYRLKYGCCLYYKIEGGEYCYTCPRLKEEDRLRQRMAYRNPSQASASS
ncbi:(2Fe-2S)-binding protein [Paenibacillus sp. GCM10023252]|uniref:(2Fe-2S)-binding protein n=1 Tax=Paenibacillus sp. GCM10023252 TaxID=3252649 RepID=UPI003612D5F5